MRYLRKLGDYLRAVRRIPSLLRKVGKIKIAVEQVIPWYTRYSLISRSRPRPRNLLKCILVHSQSWTSDAARSFLRKRRRLRRGTLSQMSTLRPNQGSRLLAREKLISRSIVNSLWHWACLTVVGSENKNWNRRIQVILWLVLWISHTLLKTPDSNSYIAQKTVRWVAIATWRPEAAGFAENAWDHRG